MWKSLSCIKEKVMKLLYTFFIFGMSVNISAGDEQFLSVIKGAGSFDLKPFIDRNIARYNKIYPCPCFTYKSDKSCFGSEDGREALYSYRVSFAGSDIAATRSEQDRQPDCILSIPIVFSAISVVYNLPTDDPCCKFPRNFTLRLTEEDIIDIFFRKKCVSWASLLRRPYNNICYKGDAYIQAIYPCAASELSTVLAYLLCWPWNCKGENQCTSNNVAARVKATHGTIGYTTFAQAQECCARSAEIESIYDCTQFVEPCLESIRKAAEGLCDESVTKPKIPCAYPLTFKEYLIVYANQPSEFIACNLAQFIYFVLTEGQKFARCLNLVPLPRECFQADLVLLDEIRSVICKPCVPPCNPCKPCCEKPYTSTAH